MSKTTIVAGSTTYANRDRRFYCEACREIFTADYQNYQIADNGEMDLGVVIAMSECPTCGRWAYAPMGSKGEVVTNTSLIVRSLPVKQIYRPGETLDLTGLVIGVQHSDGAILNHPATDFTFSPASGATLTTSDQSVTATLTGTELTATIPIYTRNEVIPLVELADDGVYVYTGSATGVNVRYWNTDTSTRSNNSKTSVGEYTATYTPKTGYCWPGGSTSAVSIDWEIIKATPTVTAPTPKTGLTYTGAAQALCNAGTTDFGTINYKVGTGGYGTSVPTATAAGTYTVYWKVPATSNTEAVAEHSFTVTIAKAQAADPVVSPTTMSLTVGGDAGTATVTVEGTGAITVSSSSGNVCTASKEGTTVTVTPVGAGTATVSITGHGDSNYLDPLHKATIAVTVAAEEVESEPAEEPAPGGGDSPDAPL